jgi:HEAT repeat protein
MKLLYFICATWMAGVCWSAELPADVDLPISYQKEALANSLRCLETIRGDDYRTALTRIWVSENLAYLGDENAAVNVLRASAPHYVIPYGCVESALALLGHGQNQAARQLLELAIDLLPFTAGRGGEEVQFQAIKMAIVLEEPKLVEEIKGKVKDSI